MAKPWEIAEKLRGLAAVGDGARHAAVLMEAADQLEVLRLIHAELDGHQWDSDTTENIAGYLGSIGLDVGEPE